MIRVEQIVKEADIRHEIETYNELLGAEGELGATLLIEIENPDERRVSSEEVASSAGARLRRSSTTGRRFTPDSMRDRWVTTASPPYNI